MKSAQWTAVLILVLMVGGISFVTVYLGGSSSSEQQTFSSPTEAFASLTFPNKVFPREGEKPQTTEVRYRGYQDYWFVNDSGQEVIVGVREKGCTCSEVELTVAPPSWQPYIAGMVVTQALAQPPRSLADLTTLAAAADRDRVFPELPDGEAGATFAFTRDNSTRVPAGAIGRVRLSWRQEQGKLLQTWADLWMGQRDSSVGARLDAIVFIAPPLGVDRELSMPAITEADLKAKPDGQRGYLYCWSLTRPAFQLTVKQLHEQLKPESDAVEVGEPVLLTGAEFNLFQQREKFQRTTVLTAYRVPVTMRAKAKDGTPIEWGQFLRIILFSSSSEAEPIPVRVSGVVLGAIVVGGGGKGGGALNLGPFSRRHGIRGDKPNNTIILETDEEDFDLELDRTRVPEYLKPHLSKPRQTKDGHRMWVLRVEVPPNEARGSFPRADDPVYSDSAIYVKTNVRNAAKASRSIRIPVLGVANDG